jgi:uncharacterized protein
MLEPDSPPSGLKTPEKLSWFGRIRLMIRRQSRAFYRSVRHPKNRRRGALRGWLAERIKNRELWRPSRDSVAAGLGGGVFFAMLPIPLQSFVAAGVGMARGWNLPAAISSTWLSNPVTYVPMIIAARSTIAGCLSLFNIESAAGQMSVEKLKTTLEVASNLKLGEAWRMAGPALAEILLGMAVLGFLMGVGVWLAVQVCWRFVQLVRVKSGPVL